MQFIIETTTVSSVQSVIKNKKAAQQPQSFKVRDLSYASDSASNKKAVRRPLFI